MSASASKKNRQQDHKGQGLTYGHGSREVYPHKSRNHKHITVDDIVAAVSNNSDLNCGIGTVDNMEVRGEVVQPEEEYVEPVKYNTFHM